MERIGLAKTTTIKNSRIKKTRKFQEFDSYSLASPQGYFLLPFRFHRLNPNREILVNEVGDFLIVPTGTAECIIEHKLNKIDQKELYADLISGFFISEERIPPLLSVLSTRYRTKKSFLDNFTALHIFVISLRCEHTCHYCQVSRATQDKNAFDMKRSHIDKGIEFMMKSPNPNVTMEFQGGEALLAFESIVYAVEKAKMESEKFNKRITFVICTNLAPLNNQILSFCKENDILISTSLDGPAFIHNANRRRPENNSYELAISGIHKCREVLGDGRVSALLTTTNLSIESN